jgi:hypothetical protein
MDWRSREFTTVVTGGLLLAVLHGVVFCLQPPVKIDLDFARMTEPSPYITGAWGWQVTPEGLTVPENVESLLTIGLDKSLFEEVFLRVETTSAGRGKVVLRGHVATRARITTDSIPKSTTSTPDFQLEFGLYGEEVDVSSLVADQPINLARVWPDWGALAIYVLPLEGATGPLIKSIEIRRVAYRWSVLLTLPFHILLAAAVVRLETHLRGALSFQTTVMYGVLSAILIVFLPTELLNMSWVLGAAVGGAGLLPWFLGRDQRSPTWLLLLLLTFLATWTRFYWLQGIRFQPLDPDAIVYQNIARQMHWFYDSGMREPLFVFVTRAFQLIFGDHDLSIRFVSLLASVLMVPVVYWAGREISGSATGLIAAVLVASSSSWASQASRGLRLEMFTLALLAFAAAMLTQRVISARRHGIWLGFAATAICLLRVTSLWFCVIGAAYAIYRRGWDTKTFAIAVLIPLIAVLPFWLYCASQYGDPFIAVNRHIKFYRNLEFQGSPGMPTAEELVVDAYAGPDVSSWQYFFGMHSPFELAGRSVTGLRSVFFGAYLGEHTCGDSALLVWWAVASYCLVAARSNRFLLLWMILLVGPIAWLYNGQSGPEWRLTFHTSVFVYLCMGMAVEVCAPRFKERIAS